MNASLAFAVQEKSLPVKSEISEAGTSELRQAREDAKESAEALKNMASEELLEKGKEHAAYAIQQRLLSLNQAQERIENIYRIRQEEKDKLLTNLENAKNGLLVIQTQLKNETNLDQLRASIKSIYSGYKIYAATLPKNHGLLACNVASYVIDEKIITSIDSLNIIITELQDAGYDTAGVEEKIVEFSSYISAAKTEAESACAEFEAVQPSQVSEISMPHIDAGKVKMLNVKSNLQIAKDVFQEIVIEIRSLTSR